MPTPTAPNFLSFYCLGNLVAKLAATPGHEMVNFASVQGGGLALVANPHGTETRVCEITNGQVVCHGQIEEDGRWIYHGKIGTEDGLLWLVGGAG